MDETDENRQAAREWVEQNAKKLAKMGVLSVDVVRHYVPAYVVCEMTPEHEYTDADYTELVTKMKREGYVAHVHPRLNSFECGDATSRSRFFAVLPLSFGPLGRACRHRISSSTK